MSLLKEDQDNWTASETIRKAQSGDLCKGILLTDDIDELLKKRETAVEVKDNLVFSGPLAPVETFSKEYSSQSVTQLYQNNIDKSSSSKGFSASASYFGVKVGGGYSSTRNEERKEVTGHFKNETFLAVMHCEKVSVKSVNINRHHLSLTPHLIKELQRVEQNIKHLQYRSRGHFENIFQTYGSHASQGVIEFGGILMSTASQRGFKESERSVLTDITSDVSKASLDVAFSRFGFGASTGTSFDASRVQDKMTGHYSTKDLKNVEVSLKRIGGPIECNDKMEWRRGLVKNNSLWRITNRYGQPIPLWELLESHQDSFGNCALLANAMRTEWESRSSTKNLVNLKSLQDLRRDVHLWQHYTQNDMVDCMKKLAHLRSKHIVSAEDWFEEVLYLPVVQEKITAAVNDVSTKQGTMEELLVRTSLRTIMHPIKNIKSKHLKNVTDIERLFDDQPGDIDTNPFPISMIRDISKCLQSALKELDVLSRGSVMQNFPDSGQKASVLKNTCHRLESTILAWETRHKPDFDYLVCLAVLHLHGFDLTQKSFEYYPELDDIRDIAKLLDQSIEKIDDTRDTMKKQAFLLNLALSSPHNKEKTVKYMLDKMPGQIDPELKKCWEKSSNSTENKIKLTYLKSVINKYLGDDNTDENLLALAQSIKRKLESVMQKGQAWFKEKKVDINQFDLNESAQELLEILNLKQYYPQKLTYEEVILLTPDILKDVRQKPKDLSELPWYFMKQIIGLNCNVREEGAKILDSDNELVRGTDIKTGCTVTNLEKNVAMEDDWEENWEHKEENITGQQDDIKSTVHPLDIVTAVFLCADDFLRQELADKMAKCQYAVPFMLPLPQKKEDGESKMLLHWGLKSISRIFWAQDSLTVADKKEDGTKPGSPGHHAGKEMRQESKSVHKTLIDVEGPLVSCISLGKETSWKLKLLNKMLSPFQETFWHEGLSGGNCQQILSEGLAEVAWYLPGGKSDDKFSEPVTFVNYRGDALECPEVSDTLVEFSSVTCIFTSRINKSVYSFLRSRQHNLAKVILVVLYQQEDKNEIEKGSNQLKTKLQLGGVHLLKFESVDANFDKLLETLKKSIEALSLGSRTSISELVSNTKITTSFSVDDENCAEGLAAAMDILTDIDEYNRLKPGSAKSIVLPCQSDIETREQMAKCDKEACRQKGMRDGEIEKYVQEQENKKWKLELKQLQYPISKTFMKFLQYILNFRGIERRYFLQGLKLELNTRSIELLQPLREMYQKCRVREENKETLNDLGSRLTHGSLGIEHFFREIAVMYENVAALGKKIKNTLLNDLLESLARVVAELLLEGTAIELLDGDVVHSPVTWLHAVLDQIECSAQVKVFKASVLGAQSSGKSTVLNTAFGLNFPVSSGRCTRGVYMQLVKLRDDLVQQLKCNYLMVIDSEGLMSRTMAERSDYDNELATFVIGLSDLTLVIIKGEGNEMQDVLPIAILVFMRMNKVGEQQACRFVHQNMGAVDVEATSSLEIDAFVKLLDEKTLAAAKDTDQSGQYESFTDVLHYDKIRDNTFVPGLFAGTPPMGKTDIHYSLKMQELKKDILLRIRDVAKMKEHPTLQQFSKWLAEIWRAIKYENFVFSFKNVFAIEAYNKLTKIYDERHWALKGKIRNMMTTEETTIPNLAMREHVLIEERIETAVRKIENEINMLTGELRISIGNYFPCEHEKGPERDCCKAQKISNLQIDNKKEFEDNTNNLQRTLMNEVHTRMDALKIKVQTDIRIHQLSTEMDETLKRRVQELVREQKSKNLKTTEIERIFREMWTEATGDIMRKVKLQDKEIDIKTIVQNIVIRLLHTNKIDHVYREALKTKGPQPQGFKIKEDHLRLKETSETKGIKNKAMAVGRKVGNYFYPQVTQSDYEKLYNETKQIISSADEVYKFSTDGKEFVEKDAESLFLDILGKIVAIEMEKVVTTKYYKVHLLMYMEDRAARCFTALHNQYRDRSSPKALLEKKKKSYLTLFKNEMGQGNAAVDLCNDALKGIIVQNVEKKLSNSELLQKLKVHCKDVFDDIRTLQASIMVDLYQANSFEKYCYYISQYESAVKEKMMQASIECFEKNDLLRKIAKTHLESVLDCMNEAVAEAVKRFSLGKNFVEIFFHHLSDLWIPHEELSAYYDIKIEKQKECEQFGKLILEQLGTVRKEIEEQIDGWNVAEKLNLAERNLANYLFKEVVGCTHRCPFCMAPCDKHSGGKTGGDHSATLHRPPGVGGGAWSPDGIINNDLQIEPCPANVASQLDFWHGKPDNRSLTPYKEYRSIFPNWQILPDADFESERYWKYVFAKFNDQWAKYYNAKPAKLEKLGPQWMNYTVDDLKEEMDKYYKSTLDMGIFSKRI